MTMTNKTAGGDYETKTIEKENKMSFADTMTEKAGLDKNETKIAETLQKADPKQVERFVKKLMDYDKHLTRAQAEKAAAVHFELAPPKKAWTKDNTTAFLDSWGVGLYWDELRDRVMIENKLTKKTKIMQGAIETKLALEMQKANTTLLSLPQAKDYIHSAIIETMEDKKRNIIREELLGGLAVEEFAKAYKGRTDKIKTLYEEIMDIHDPKIQRELDVFFGCAARQMVLNTLETGFYMECMLVILGKQRKGKSTLCKRLMPWEMYFKRLRHFDPRNKDDRMYLHSAALVEIAEARDIFKNTSRDFWKAEVTGEIDEDRPPYAPAAFPIPRHVFYICTTNDLDIIFDNTGTRRFVIIELGPNFKVPRLKKYDKEWFKDLWRQFLAFAINNPDKLFLDDEEYEEQEQRNENHRVMNGMEAQIYSLLDYKGIERSDVKKNWDKIRWRQKAITPADFGREMAKYASKSKLFALMTKGVKYENSTALGKMLTRWADVGLAKRIGSEKHYKYILPVYVNDLYADLLEAHGDDGFPEPFRLPEVEQNERGETREVVRWDERVCRFESRDYPQDEPYKSLWVKTYREYIEREKDNTAMTEGEIIYRAEQHADRIVDHQREINEEDEEW